MKSLKVHLLFFALLTCSQALWGQKSMRDSSITFAQFGIVYGGTAPGGDLAERFGYSNTIGGEIGLKHKSNLCIQASVRFLFGRDIRETIAGNITQLVGSPETGYTPMVIGVDGRLYEVRMYERGLVIPLTVSYVLPVLRNNPNSGPYIEAGGQFIKHKVRLEVPGNNYPTLRGDYLKGYDRLTMGIGLVEGIGYRLHNNSRLINFIAGFECSQNFTRGMRDLQFDTGLPGTGTRMDLMFGFKAAWIFPVYRSAPDDLYYR